MIRLDGLAVERGGRAVLSGIDARLEAGLVHAIIGPNGAGKTTLLRAILGELPVAAGSIAFGERALAARAGAKAMRAWRDAFAYMPQDNAAELGMTVLEVVVLGRLGRLALHVDDEVLEAAMQRLEEAGIAHLANRPIASLSGGQRQLALFAQVLMREPQAMLLDEPVSALDLRHQLGLLDLVRRETRRKNWVTLVVLHDLNLACQYADNLLLVADGTLKASGSPRTLVDAELIGSVYGVDVEILADRAGNPVIQPLGRRGATAPQDTSFTNHRTTTP